VYLGIIGAVGLVGRVLFVRTEAPIRFLTDEFWFVVEARRVFSSHPFTDPVFGYPTALHGPLGAVVLAPLAWLLPHSTSSLRLFSALIGTATVISCGVVGRRFGGHRVGLAAAVVAALTPDLWMASGLVGDDALAALLFVWVVAVTYAALDRWTWPRGVALGVLLGLLTLCFTGSLEVTAVLLVGLACHEVRRAGPRARLRGALASLVAVAALLVVLAPWLAFNHHRFHGNLVITTELGQTLNQSNNAATYFQGPDFGYQTILPPPVSATSDQKMSEPTMDRIERDQALGYVRTHWTRLVYVLPLRALWEWSLWRPGLVADREVLMGFPSWTGDVQAVGTWILLALGAAGLWLLRRRGVAVWPLVALLVLATANGVAFTPSYRYRMGGIIALIFLAAVAVDRGRTVWTARPQSARSPGTSSQQRREPRSKLPSGVGQLCRDRSTNEPLPVGGFWNASAKHVVVEGQETCATARVPLGSGADCQLAPPSTVVARSPNASAKVITAPVPVGTMMPDVQHDARLAQESDVSIEFGSPDVSVARQL
jgi:4-amino-4-deoxy-L-arabinose transferase-like glycosyltransferase